MEQSRAIRPAFSCPGDCTEDYSAGQNVTLTATPDAGGTFLGWSGDCTGTSACVVSMTQARNVTATFDTPPPPQTLTVAVTGDGTVTSNPAGISCPGDCTEDYSAGQNVTLTATPNAGSTFVGWSGDCTGTSPCVVSMTQTRNVTATFDTPPQTLTVSVTGNGTVTSNPAGISCPGDCTEDYSAGQNVTLTAAPNAGSTFVGWSGDCTGTGVCAVSMTQARNVTATFDISSLLFSDDFNDGNFAGWNVVDEGIHATPSAWSAATGTLRQSTNIHDGNGDPRRLAETGDLCLVWQRAGLE